MKISRYTKAIVYQAVAAILLAFSTVFQLSIRSQGGLERAYFRSNTFLFVMAAVLLGTAVYSFRAFTRRHREHTADSLFLLLIGLGLMAASVFAIVSFGGLEAPFTDTGYTAANVNILVLSLLPAPFILRGLVLALSRSDFKSMLHRAALIVFALVGVAYILALGLGGILRLVHYPENSSYSSGYTEDIAEE